MAGQTDSNLRQSVAAAVILKLAAERSEQESELQAQVLRLAATLVQLVELEPRATGGGAKSDSEGVGSALEEWRSRCSEVLASLTYPLGGLDAALEGKPAPTATEELAALTQQLTRQASKTSDSLTGACGALRNQTNRLLQRASQYGVTARELQMERVRLKEDLAKSELANTELIKLRQERGLVMAQMEALQERLQKANFTPQECARLEAEVREMEARAAESVERLVQLRNRHAELEEQMTSLPTRVKETENLIQELELSPDRQVFLLVQEIWQRVKAQHDKRS